ncbi:MAG: enoyl-CoA hydratase [Rhodospirillaceae bacterium]|nr:enoyl-CoA hydratase [Rhodospirillaceae bacterium]|tara:strand:- start:15268 stop:16023 length:756 start_codon:yes stop_codon:yes gene_type:complete
MAGQIETKRRGGIVDVILQRPEKLNALSASLIDELTSTMVVLADDNTLHCVVISGAGRAFSAGADVAELNSLNAGNAEDFIRMLHGACQAVRDCPVPVIAKIDGPCLGGALELAASCDMRVASERSTFAMPEVQIGIPSVIEAALLPRLMGWGRASAFLFTGTVMSADCALCAGLVERVASSARLDDAVTEWVDAICSAGPLAIRAQKALMRHWEGSFVDAAIEAGVDAFREAHRTDEPATKLHEVMAKRS